MRTKRVFLTIWIPLWVIIFAIGMYKTLTGGYSSAFVEQGVVIWALYGAVVAAIIAGIAAAIASVIFRGKPAPPSPEPAKAP